jgi:hypothetical protein
MKTPGGLGSPGGGRRAVGESTTGSEREAKAAEPIAYVACPVCRAPIALPQNELPPRIACESCGAILER